MKNIVLGIMLAIVGLLPTKTHASYINPKYTDSNTTMGIRGNDAYTEVSKISSITVPLWREMFSDYQPTDYFIYSINGGLIISETVQFGNAPSEQLENLLHTSDFLFENGNTRVYLR